MSKAAAPAGAQSAPLTPELPWRYDAESGEILGRDDWPLVAMVLTSGIDKRTRDALGSFIVESCNARAPSTSE